MNRRSTSTLGLSKGLDDTLLVPQDYNAAMEEVSHRTSQTDTDQGDCTTCLMVYNCVLQISTQKSNVRQMKLNKKLLEAKEKEEESRLEWQLQVISKCSVAVGGNDRKTAKCTKNISECYRLQSHENEISKNTEKKVASN